MYISCSLGLICLTRMLLYLIYTLCDTDLFSVSLSEDFPCKSHLVSTMLHVSSVFSEIRRHRCMNSKCSNLQMPLDGSKREETVARVQRIKWL